MKTYATAEMHTVPQAGMETYDLTINFQIPELLLDIDLAPFIEKIGKSYKKLSNIEEYILNELENRKYLVFKSYDDKGSSYELDIMAQMSTIIEIVFSALDKCSKDGRKPFHVNISDPKNKISEYGDKWSEMIDQLKSVKNSPIETDIKENNDILDKLSIIEGLVRDIGTLSSKPQKKATKKEKQIEVEQVSGPTQNTINLMNLIPNLDEEYAR